MTSRFKQALESGKFVVTSEIAPPKGTNLEIMKHHIELLKDKVDAMNVTDHQSSVMRYPSLGAAFWLKNRRGSHFANDLPGSQSSGVAGRSALCRIQRIQNVLCLTGDSIILGDHKQAKSVFDLDSSQLLETVRLLAKGKDLGGNDLDGPCLFAPVPS